MTKLRTSVAVPRYDVLNQPIESKPQQRRIFYRVTTLFTPSDGAHFPTRSDAEAWAKWASKGGRFMVKKCEMTCDTFGKPIGFVVLPDDDDLLDPSIDGRS